MGADILAAQSTKVARSLSHVADFQIVGFTVAAVLSSPVGAQGIVMQKNITLDLAQTIANAAIAQCRSMAYKISVTVVDREGLPIVMMRDDGAGYLRPKEVTAKPTRHALSARLQRISSRGCRIGGRRSARGTIGAFCHLAADCQSKWVTKSSARSASLAHPGKTTTARRPASTRSPIN